MLEPETNPDYSYYLNKMYDSPYLVSKKTPSRRVSTSGTAWWTTNKSVSLKLQVALGEKNPSWAFTLTKMRWWAVSL